MKIIIRKESILKDYKSIRDYCMRTGINQSFIIKWDNNRPKSVKILNNAYIKKLIQDGYVDTFRLIGNLSYDSNAVIEYPKKLNNKDFFIQWGRSEYPYEFLYCDFVVNGFDNIPVGIKNVLTFLDKNKIRVISKEEYYNELRGQC